MNTQYSVQLKQELTKINEQSAASSKLSNYLDDKYNLLQRFYMRRTIGRGTRAIVEQILKDQLLMIKQEGEAGFERLKIELNAGLVKLNVLAIADLKYTIQSVVTISRSTGNETLIKFEETMLRQIDYITSSEPLSKHPEIQSAAIDRTLDIMDKTLIELSDDNINKLLDFRP